MRTQDIQVFQNFTKTVYYRKKRVKRIRFPYRIREITESCPLREFWQNMLSVKLKYSKYFQTGTEIGEKDSV